MDADGVRELFLLRPGSDGGNGVAELYDYQKGAMERSTEATMSVPVESLKRVTTGGMYRDIQAVFVSSNFDEETIITDVYAILSGRFTNVSASNESGTSVKPFGITMSMETILTTTDSLSSRPLSPWRTPIPTCGS